MRPYSIAGLTLIVLGILAICVHSITYFTNDQVTGPLGFLAWNISEPHTIFFNPIVGAMAVVVGIALMLMSSRRTLV